MNPVTSTRPATVEEFLRDVEELGPRLEAAAEGNEAAGEVDPAIIHEMEQRGYGDLLAPARYGGHDFTPLQGLQILEALSYHDVATAWVFMVRTTHPKFLDWLDRSVTDRLYENGTPRMAGSAAPSGTAVEVDGGYRVSGRWAYASGYSHADLIVSSAVVTRDGEKLSNDDGSPLAITFFLPKEQTVPLGNWDVLGLKATGSIDYEIIDQFVPFSMVTPGYSSSQNDVDSLSALVGFTGWIVFDHQGPDLGIGRRILDEMREQSQKAGFRRGKPSDSEVFRQAYAQAEARFRSARAWIYAIWHDVETTIRGGSPMTRQQHTDARNALLHLNRVNKQNALWVYEESGGAGLHSGVIQRFYRDQSAASQHLHVSRKFYQPIAADYLGEAEGYVWMPHALVPPAG